MCLDPYLVYEISHAIKALEFLHGIKARDIKSIHDLIYLRSH